MDQVFWYSQFHHDSRFKDICWTQKVLPCPRPPSRSYSLSVQGQTGKKNVVFVISPKDPSPGGDNNNDNDDVSEMMMMMMMMVVVGWAVCQVERRSRESTQSRFSHPTRSTFRLAVSPLFSRISAFVFLRTSDSNNPVGGISSYFSTTKNRYREKNDPYRDIQSDSDRQGALIHDLQRKFKRIHHLP